MKLLKRLLMVLGGLTALMVLAIIALLVFVPGLHLSSLEMILNVMTGRGGDHEPNELLARLQAAEGYSVSVFARDLPHPRMLARDTAGNLLVSNPRSGEVILLADRDGDGAADTRELVLDNLARPHGLALHDGFLYVAESNRVGRAAWDPAAGDTVAGDYEIIADGFTDNGNHWSKTIAFGPAGHLYLAMGSTCNVCEEPDARRATIMRFNADGSDGRIYASGLRNSVGMAFAPWDGSLYATDNGRDLLGDDYPPCELNRVVDGGFYGWPYRNGDNVADPDFGGQRPDLEATAIAPAFNFPAHNAPLGIYFARTGQREALVALHGSWNRSIPDGYKVVSLHWQEDGSISSSDFLWGFEEDGNIVGRPVDIVGDGAGGYYISDDYARVIYRVSPRQLASASTGESGSAAAVSVDPGMAQLGEALYRKLPCRTCHAPDTPTPVPLDNLAQKYSLQELADYFLTPTPPMPRYPLSEEQRQQLAHYLLGRG
jgi:glucose/arabinose dehydrogenase